MNLFNVGDRVFINNVIFEFSDGTSFRLSVVAGKEPAGTITEVVPMYGGGYKYFLALDSGGVFSSSHEGLYFDDHSLTKIDNPAFDISGLEKLI